MDLSHSQPHPRIARVDLEAPDHSMQMVYLLFILQFMADPVCTAAWKVKRVDLVLRKRRYEFLRVPACLDAGMSPHQTCSLNDPNMHSPLNGVKEALVMFSESQAWKVLKRVEAFSRDEHE